MPRTVLAGRSAFLKLGARRYLVISIAMVAARIAIAGDRIAQAAVAVGSCSAAARRLSNLEAALAGAATSDIAAIVAAAELPELSPIDDVRGTADYRGAAARELVARAVTEAAGLPPRRTAGRAA